MLTPMSDDADTRGTTTPDATDAPRRSPRAWVLVVIGGALATFGGMSSLASIANSALGGTRSWAGVSFIALVLGIVIGGLVAARGFGLLGVRRGWRTALLGGVVGVVGFLAPWVVVIVLTHV